jgi:hypothetical protein
MNNDTYRSHSLAGRFISYSWAPFLIGIVYLSTRLASSHGHFTDRVYTHHIYNVVASFLSYFSGSLGFSLWDIFWVVAVLLLLMALLTLILRRVKLLMFINLFIRVIAVLYAFFYLVWGYNYFRPPIADRLGWRIPPDRHSLFLPALDTLIKETNKNYIRIRPSDYNAVNALVEASYSSRSGKLGIEYPNGSRNPKIMLFSRLYSKMGLSGYFGPFFNEIHVNGYLVPIDYPFLLAHEKAHQFGITSEAEANLAAFDVCISSADQRLRYSGYQSLLLYFLRDAVHLPDYKSILAAVSDSVLNDLRFRQKYYLGLQDETLSNIQSKANDSYLKVNKVHSGVLNYNEVVSLVIDRYYNEMQRDSAGMRASGIGR